MILNLKKKCVPGMEADTCISTQEGSMPAWATEQDLVSKNKNKQKRKENKMVE
jgi:hypothetical protein